MHAAEGESAAAACGHSVAGGEDEPALSGKGMFVEADMAELWRQ